MTSIKTPIGTIIVPIYKCGDLIDPLLESLCSQTYEDLEIICVLDGEDPEVEKRIREKAKEDPRLKCVVQEHAGAGAARNTGIDHARGKYLLFLDADDQFDPSIVEKLAAQAERHNADLVMCTYAQVNHWTNQRKKNLGIDEASFPEGQVIDPAGVDDLFVSYEVTPCNRMIRRDLVEENGLRFSRTRVANDVFFVVASMTCARRVVALREDLLTIHRYINKDSISSNRAAYTEDAVAVFDEIRLWLKKKGLWRKYRSTYMNLFRNSVSYNSTYSYNEKFVDAAAKALCQDPPWKSMGNEEVMEIIDFANLEKVVAWRDQLEDDIAALKNMDNSGRERLREMYQNRIDNTHKIIALAREKYGRDLEKPDPVLTALAYSLRKRGLKGTMLKIREGREGEKVLDLKNVICAGHITTARTIVEFTLPLDISEGTSRTQALVDDLTVVIRCNGYYPVAFSGEKGEVSTPLGPGRVKLQAIGKPIRKSEIRRSAAKMVPGIGLNFKVVFVHPLGKNRKGTPVDNNQPVTVTMEGKIRLK